MAAIIVPVPTPEDLLTITSNGVIPSYRLVGYDDAVCGANAPAKGVTLDMATADDEVVAIVNKGVVLCTAGGDVTVGAAVVSTSAGKVVVGTAMSVTVAAGATPVTSSGAQPTIAVAGGVPVQAVVGYALDAGAADTLVRIKLVI